MEKHLEEYVISPEFNAAAVTGATRRERNQQIDQQIKDGLAAIRQPVADIAARTGGQVIGDGKGFGVKDDPQQYDSFMLVKLTKEAAEEARGVKGVDSVEKNRLFDVTL